MPEPGGSAATVALVTGASRGIGRAVAVALARSGLAVAIAYRSDRGGAEEVVEKLRAEGAQAITVQLDVTDERSVDQGFRTAEGDLGPPAVVVNNAGFTKDGLAVRYPMDAWDRTLEVNVRGTFLCSRRAIPSMLKARWGRIVNIASAAALRGNAGQTAYVASKHAVVGFTRSLARELGGRGITANAVCPGFVETAMTAPTTDEIRRRWLELTPAGRYGTPEEIANVVAFLASDEASYVNGAVIAVDGGLTA